MSPPRRSNPARLLSWSQLGRAVRQRDWMNVPAPDGGVPILRVAVVIARLEARGHKFDRRKFGHGEVEYWLAREPAVMASGPTTVEPSTTQDALLSLEARSTRFWEHDQ